METWVQVFCDYPRIQLNRYPVKRIPKPTIPKKIRMSFVFITRFRIMNSGNERPVTAIIKASDVPRLTPFSVRTLTSGTIPAALE